MRRVAVVIVPVLVLLAGCSGGGESAGSTPAAAKAGTSDSRQAPSGGGVQTVADKAKPVAVPRSLIRTAQLDVRVHDVKKAATAAQRIVEAAGGDVSDEQLDLRAAHPTASLQLQVPPARLGSTLTSLSDLGDEQSRRLGTDDVTEQVVDLDSRIATQRTSVARVRALLDRASSLTDIVGIESELSRREADLESLEARMRALSGQVAMSEITLSLSDAPAAAKPASAVDFTSGLTAGWHAFTTTARIAGATVGAVLPFLPLLVAALWGGLWWRRRVSAA